MPAPRASDLQIVLRTREHAAYYDPASNELSLQRRNSPRSLEPPGSGASSVDAPLVPHRSQSSTSQSVLQRFPRPVPLAGGSHKAVCPTCARPWPLGDAEPLDADFRPRFPDNDADRESPSFIAPNYFRLLAQATTTHAGSSGYSTRPTTPSLPRNRFESASGSSTPLPPSGASTPPEPIAHASEAQGYYARFFVELKRLGRGARGQVYLCQHVLNGNQLGKYAIKKIPVGDHASSLLHSLNEVHLMESLHHPHLIHYQHAWIERCQLSAFAPEVPTLFVLMMAANGGSLADWISARAGDAAGCGGSESGAASGNGAGVSNGKRRAAGGREGDETNDSSRNELGSSNPVERRRIERLKAALRQRRANRTAAVSASHPSPPPPPFAQPDVEVGVHLLRLEEIYSLLSDMTSGLAFLHDRGILHLDLKPGNVLLHWDDDALLPRAMLSDFGSSLLLHDNWGRTRSGHTGTMEYMAPETIVVDAHTGRLRELSSKADVWSLGMILHVLLFFRLPFQHVDDVARLRGEIESYSGFKREEGWEKGRGDAVLLGLLERMLHVQPAKRPSCGEILKVIAQRPPEEKTQRRKKHNEDGDESGNASLALYRPSTLPAFPTSTHTSLDSQNNDNDGSAIQPRNRWWVSRGLAAVPDETTAVALALLKCLSPSIVSRVLHSRHAQTVVPTDATTTLLVLCALIDLAARRRGVSALCWTAHAVLLSMMIARSTG